jgi:hypothetical protein
MDIVIDFAVVTVVGVALAWAVNSGIPLLGRLFGQIWELPTDGKKAVAFAASTGLVYAWKPPVALPDPAVDPFAFAFALLTQAEIVFKTAQEVYDHLWRAITEKIAGLFK